MRGSQVLEMLPSWEERNLGFFNHTQAVRGALLLNDARLRRAELQAAVLSGRLDHDGYTRMLLEMLVAEQRFCDFLREFTIAD